MFKLLKLKKIKNILLTAVFAYIFISLFFYKDSIYTGIKTGYNFCLNLLIPSLFLFMVFSQLTLNFNISNKLESVLNKIAFKLFKLPGICVIPILTGLVGGYPVGAINIKTLLENNLITKKQAECLIYFLVGAGPAFIINVVGVSLFSSRLLGILLFISQLVSSVGLGIIVSNFFMSKNLSQQKTVSNNFLKQNKISFSKSLILAINKTSKNLFYMCSLIVFFSALINIFKKFASVGFITKALEILHISKIWADIFISIFFEVTNGCKLVIKNHLPIFFVIFAISWAGISVHMQIFSILKDLKFSKIKFMFFRILHSVLSTVIFYVLLLFITDDTKTSLIRGVNRVCVSSFSHAPSSFSLLIMCICFLFTLTDHFYKCFPNRRAKIIDRKL